MKNQYSDKKKVNQLHNYQILGKKKKGSLIDAQPESLWGYHHNFDRVQMTSGGYTQLYIQTRTHRFKRPVVCLFMLLFEGSWQA